MAPLTISKSKRKGSILNRSYQSTMEPFSPLLSLDCSPATPSTPCTERQHTSTGFRSILSRFRDPDAQPTMLLTPPSSSPPKPSPPEMSTMTKAFVDSLTTQQLSNFMTWFLYYDIVELPESPEAWYESICPMEMRGWVALGAFLSIVKDTGYGYGFDLVVLDSICDRLKLDRSTVHEVCIHFADPAKMASTSLSLAVHDAEIAGKSRLETLEVVQDKLHELYKLGTNLKPQECSRYDVWQVAVQKRLHGFLHLVVGARIKQLRFGRPLLTAATTDRLSQEAHEAIKLNYYFEAIQQSRIVPVARYSNHTDTTPDSPFQATTSVDTTNCEAELSHNHAVQLMVDNHDLRAQISSLKYENQKLVVSNEKLAQKVAPLTRHHALGHRQELSTPRQSMVIPLPSLSLEDSPFSRPRHHRSPSASAISTLSTLSSPLPPQLHPPLLLLRRHLLPPQQQPISPSPSPVRLSDPGTGELAEPAESVTPTPVYRVGWPERYAPGVGRRSGRVSEAIGFVRGGERGRNGGCE